MPLKLYERCVLDQQMKIRFFGVSLHGHWNASDFSLSPHKTGRTNINNYCQNAHKLGHICIRFSAYRNNHVCQVLWSVSNLPYFFCPSSFRRLWTTTLQSNSAHDSDPESRDVSRDVSLWLFMPKRMRFRQLPSFMSNVQDTLESPPSVT